MAASSDSNAGDMETGEHVATYRAFNGLVKWGSLLVAALVLFMVMMFSTHAGFIPSAIVTVLLLVIGGVGLKSRGGSGH